MRGIYSDDADADLGGDVLEEVDYDVLEEMLADAYAGINGHTTGVDRMSFCPKSQGVPTKNLRRQKSTVLIGISSIVISLTEVIAVFMPFNIAAHSKVLFLFNENRTTIPLSGNKDKIFNGLEVMIPSRFQFKVTPRYIFCESRWGTFRLNF